MKTFLLLIIFSLCMFVPSKMVLAKGLQQQILQAKETLQVLNRQFNRYYTTHKKFPSFNGTAADFNRLGIKKVPPSTWEYFAVCNKESCQIFAERLTKIYLEKGKPAQTLLLRSTYAPKRKSSRVYAESRSVLFVNQKGNTLLVEQSSAVPEGFCTHINGQMDANSDCVLK
ncbi:MAG: hypothetical protein IKP96_03195 [Elusimicrobiaceae bacterium]|nr:hypothetical protein [Elusimicrobiaceae bacterium]